MPVQLIESLATTEALAELFSDQSVLQAMLDFEVALARAEARLGIVPKTAADAIAAAGRAESFDIAALSRDSLRAGTPSIPVVKALTDKVRAADPSAAGFVHWGATSQDVADTAMVLLLKRARGVLEPDLIRVEKALRRLADQHANTVMLGRTLMQPAPPITFGLKAAGWLGGVQCGRKNLAAKFAQADFVQFGGASGTLASLGTRGIEVGRELAVELRLGFPDAPWHTQRDRLAAVVCACGVVVGSLGKTARDISLLMQSEIAEVAEPGGEGRGGSSTMPHKRNPIGCVLTLAAAQRTPGLVATFLSTMLQEHERGVGGWQAEWPTIAVLIQATGLAAASMAEVTEGLTVDVAKMRANLEATRGLIFAERATMLLAEKIGRDVAHKLLEEASRQSIAKGQRLSDVLGAMPETARHLDSAALRNLERPEEYLGVADEFRRRLLSEPENSDDKKD